MEEPLNFRKKFKPQQQPDLETRDGEAGFHFRLLLSCQLAFEIQFSLEITFRFPVNAVAYVRKRSVPPDCFIEVVRVKVVHSVNKLGVGDIVVVPDLFALCENLTVAGSQ